MLTPGLSGLLSDNHRDHCKSSQSSTVRVSVLERRSTGREQRGCGAGGGGGKRRMEGGRWEQGRGSAGSVGLTFCPCPPASRSEAAGDLGSVSVTQREARLWVSCWLWGAGPDPCWVCTASAWGQDRCPVAWGCSQTPSPPPRPCGCGEAALPVQPTAPRDPKPPAHRLQQSVLFWKESGPAWPSAFRGQFPVGCHT